MLNCVIRYLLCALLCLFSITARTAYDLNLPYGVSPMSHDIYHLHMAAFSICCVIAAIVFSIIIYSLVKFRKSKGVESAHFHENFLIEVIWTTIPIVILICLAVPATQVLWRIHNTDESALTIKVTGYQWKWQYEYLNNGIKFFSYLSTPLEQIYSNAPKNKWYLLEVDNPLVVPINTKIKLLITSDDVIHSWWVPALGVKQDAIPGFINENWMNISTPGEYRGQCSELCGVNHGFMPIVVKAVTEAEFNQFVLDQQKQMEEIAKGANLKSMPESELLKLGKQAYSKNCAMCHQNNGMGLLPSFPALKNSRVLLSPLDESIAYVLHGIPGTSMQAFGKILDDQTLAAIITYIRQSWGNGQINTAKQNATVAQPQDIRAVRQMMQ